MDDWCRSAVTNDLRTVGRFNTRMESKDRKMGFNFEGTYQDVKEHERIEYIMDDGRKATIGFVKQAAVIKIIESFDAEEMNPVEMQQHGWHAILNNFKTCVESNDKIANDREFM